MANKIYTIIVLMLTSIFTMNATNFYIQIEGTKQGKFKAEGKEKLLPEYSPCVKYFYEIKSPRDAASGQATGKRQHRPVTIVKEWGASSPQIFQALCTNEQLKKVTIQFVKTDDNGALYVYQKITLENAFVVSIKHLKEFDITSRESFFNQSGEYEEVSFTFQKILIENIDGKTSASDDWFIK